MSKSKLIVVMLNRRQLPAFIKELNDMDIVKEPNELLIYIGDYSKNDTSLLSAFPTVLCLAKDASEKMIKELEKQDDEE